jgi:hypothetical protein
MDDNNDFFSRGLHSYVSYTGEKMLAGHIISVFPEFLIYVGGTMESYYAKQRLPRRFQRFLSFLKKELRSLLPLFSDSFTCFWME